MIYKEINSNNTVQEIQVSKANAEVGTGSSNGLYKLSA